MIRYIYHTVFFCVIGLLLTADVGWLPTGIGRVSAFLLYLLTLANVTLFVAVLAQDEGSMREALARKRKPPMSQLGRWYTEGGYWLGVFTLVYFGHQLLATVVLFAGLMATFTHVYVARMWNRVRGAS